MRTTRIFRRRVTIAHAVVAQYGRDTQTIIGKDGIAARILDTSMNIEVAPGINGGLITKGRQRQQFSWSCKTLKAFNFDESIETLRYRTQACAGFEVRTFSMWMRLRLKNYDNHDLAPLQVDAAR